MTALKERKKTSKKYGGGGSLLWKFIYFIFRKKKESLSGWRILYSKKLKLMKLGGLKLMINIEVKPAKKVDGKEALFISFQYDIQTVAKVKSLDKRWYHGDTREWEVPLNLIDNVLQLFKSDEVKIKAPNNKKRSGKAKAAEKAVQPLENMAADGFQYKTKPFQHQIEAFNFALSHNSFLLGDEQGLGKTKQAIDIAVNKKLVNKFKHTLIVCGVNSLKFNWAREIQTHSNEKAKILGSYVNTKGKLVDGSIKERLADLQNGVDAFFLITNIETLRNKEVAAELKKLTSNGTIGMTIIDEIHKAKNAQASQGKAIHNLQSYFKMALTGTPLMNSPLDLYNIMKWLGYEKASFYAFRNRYCTMGGYGGYEVVGYKNMNELRSRFASAMLRRRKDEVLNLPPKLRHTEYIEMTGKQEQIYKEVMRGIKANIQEIALSPNPLAQLIRLRQATAHTSILSKTISESAKVDRLKELLEEITANGQKAIVFSNWEAVTEIVRDELKEYNPAYITGATSDREAQVDKFQNNPDCKVIIGTIGAMGTGLTLTAANHVFFMDKPWNQANTEQAEDRAHRIGTTGTVNITTLVCQGTIDERIEEIIAEKAEMAKGLVEGDQDTLARLENPANYLDRLLS